ncbi:MAG: SagB/ThcOx family dehydrogenase [Devosiaceae bacterium]
MLRTARTLVFYPDQANGLLAHNYLQNKRFGCSSETVKFLQAVWDWQEPSEIASALNVPDSQALKTQLDGMVSAGCLVSKGSQQEQKETSHRESWQWGIPSALYHTSLQNRPVISVEASLAYQAEKLSDGNDVPATIFDDLRVYDIPRVDLPDGQLTADLQDTINRRRTLRDPGVGGVELDDISACLINAVGVQRIGNNEAGAPVTFKPTPSGGGRAPYDAFVLVRNIEGLAEGVYAYDPQEHCLFQTSARIPSFGDLLDKQDWPDNMDAFIVLQANFERTMWKYYDANAYRVVLIEAGHIGQNIMLAATSRGLSACPSAAIDLNVAAEHLYNCDPVMSPAVYALGLVRPAP